MQDDDTAFDAAKRREQAAQKHAELHYAGCNPQTLANAKGDYMAGCKHEAAHGDGESGCGRCEKVEKVVNRVEEFAKLTLARDFPGNDLAVRAMLDEAVALVLAKIVERLRAALAPTGE